MNRNGKSEPKVEEQVRVCLEQENFEEAIIHLSKLLGPGEKTKGIWTKEALFMTRAEAFIGLSRKYKSTPASISESSPYFGLDPKQLAELALRDLSKVSSNSNIEAIFSEDTESLLRYYGLEAGALFVLERFLDSREILMKALTLDPTNKKLQSQLAELDDLLPSGGNPSRNFKIPKSKASESDLECVLCLRLFYDPVTSPCCGHTFCRECLGRCLDISKRCPLCRALLVLNVSSLPTTQCIKTLIWSLFPEEAEKRKAEFEQQSQGSSKDAKITLPLFVMDIVLPFQKVLLNIFEPRYRLMTRRCLETTRKFAMGGYNPQSRDPFDVACEVEIIECIPQNDGRYYVEVHGRRRLKIEELSEVDGYRVAQGTPIEDILPGTDEEKQTLHKAASDAVRLWESRPDRAFLERERGDTTPIASLIDQPERLSFSLANLIPFSPQNRLEILKETSTERRLNKISQALRAHPSEQQRCDFQ